jgi:putative phosphoesterase
VKLGIVSDIHGNLAGLQTALAAMGPVDELLCLGDSIYQYRFSNEVIGLLKTMGARLILGNHEEVFLSEAGAQARERQEVDPGLVAFLTDQPHRRLLTYGGKTVLMIHSTPWEPRGEYIYPHNEKLARFAEAGADFVLYGHTHAEVVRRIGGVVVVNPGSAGEGRYTRDGLMLSCAVLDTGTGEARVIHFRDPTDAPNERQTSVTRALGPA